jgi:hypothetical protein
MASEQGQRWPQLFEQLIPILKVDVCPWVTKKWALERAHSQ